MIKFEVEMWEKAEHWRFDITIEAVSEIAARKAVMKDYGRGYSIIRIRSVWSAS